MPSSDRIMLSFPGPGDVTYHDALGGNTFVFAFELSQASFSRTDDDLVISSHSNQEGIIQLQNLYQADSTNAPTFELYDSSTLTTPEFIQTFAPETLPDAAPNIGVLALEHDTIEFSVNESGLGDPDSDAEIHTVTLQAGFTVDVSKGGWTDEDGDGTYTRVIVVDGDEIGKFEYEENSSQLTFELTGALQNNVEAGGATTVEATITTQMWLLDPDGESVRPDVKVQIIDEVPDLGADFTFGDNPDNPITDHNCRGTFRGYWEPPSDVDAYTYSLTVNLAGYAPFEVKNFEIGKPTTVEINGVPFAEIIFNAFGMLTVQLLSDYEPTDPEQMALAGHLTLSLTAIDEDGKDSTTAKASLELNLGDHGIEVGALDAGVLLESGLRVGMVEREVPLPEGWTVYPDPQDGWIDDPSGPGWVIDDGKGELRYIGPDEGGPSLTYTLYEGVGHDPDHDEYPMAIPVRIVEIDSPDPTPVRINVVMDIVDDQPEVEFGDHQGDPFVGNTIEIDISTLVFGGDGPADPNDPTNPAEPYEVTLIFNGVPHGPVALVPGTETPVGDIGSITLVTDPLGDKLLFTPKEGGDYDIRLTITDKDGDTATTVIDDLPTIVPPAPENLTIPPVSEEYLPGGTKEGEEPPSQTITIPDGWAVDTTDWRDPDPDKPGEDNLPDDAKILDNPDGVPGKLIYNPDDDTLTFELTDPIDHPGADVPDETDDHQITIPLVHPENGATDEVTVDFSIKDDEPIVALDPDVEDNDYVAGLPVEIPITELEFGADDKADEDPYVITVTDVDSGEESDPISILPGEGPVPVVIDGETIGTIELEDGKIIFTPEEEDPGTYKIDLTITDSDGDTATGSVTIPVSDDTFLELKLGTVTESKLPDGTDTDPGYGLTVDDTLPAGWSLDTSKGAWNDNQDGTFTYVVAGLGEYTYDEAARSLTFELTDNMAHLPNLDLGTITSKFFFSYEDSVGSVEKEVKVDVRDDKPVVTVDSIIGTHFAGDDIDGTFSFAFGADGEPAAGTYDAITVTVAVDGKTTDAIAIAIGQTVTLTDQAGDPIGQFKLVDETNFTFTPAEGTSGTATITLAVTDSDGDTTEAQTEVSYIAQFTDTIDIGPVTEASLPDGTTPDPDALTQTSDPLPEGWNVDTTGWDDGPNGTKVLDLKDDPTNPIPGQLVYDPNDKTLSFELTGPYDHDPDDDEVEFTFDVPLIHDNGSPGDTPITIKIVDDQPVVTLDPAVENNDYVAGLPVEIPITDLNFGADEMADDDPYVITVTDADDNESDPISILPGDPAVPVIIDGEQVGTIELKDDKIIFTPEEEDPGTYTIDLTITDSDGDQATGSVTIPVSDDTFLELKLGTVTEAYLPDGTANDLPYGLETGNTLPTGWHLDTGKGAWNDNQDGTFTYVVAGLGEYTYDVGARSLAFELTDNLAHQPNSDLGTITSPFFFYHEGSPGTSIPKNVKVDIRDDKPIVSIDNITGDHFSGDDINGTFAYEFGADGQPDPADFDAITVTVAVDGKTTDAIAIAIGQTVTLTDQSGDPIGTFKLVDATNFTFTPEAGTSGEATITLAVTDSDGDKTEAQTQVSFDAKFSETIDIGSVTEASLPDGTTPDPDALTQTSDPLPQGWDVNTDGWDDGPNGTKVLDLTDDPVNPMPGQLVYDPNDHTLSFELTGPYDHDPDEDDVEFTITVPLIHESGSTTETPVTITIEDDQPVVTLDPAVENNDYVAGLPVEIPITDLNFGADEMADTDPYVLNVKDEQGNESGPISMLPDDPAVPVIIDGEQVGTIELKDDKIIFTPEEEDPGRYTIDLTITDSDGDQATGSVTIPVSEDDFLELKLGTVTEAYLPDGTANDLPYSLETDDTLPTGWHLDTGKGAWEDNQDGTFTYVVAGLGEYTYDEAARSLSFELTNNLAHQPNSDLGTLTSTFYFYHEGSPGASIEKDVKVDIRDDKPVVTIAPVTGTHFAGDEIEGDFTFAFGADGQPDPDDFDAITVTVAIGGKTTDAIAIGIGETVTLTDQSGASLGTFELVDETNFIFIPTTGTEGDATITLAVTDSDGDTTTAATVVTFDAKFSETIDIGTVSEAGLPDGSNPDPSALTDTSDPLTGGWKVDTNGWEPGEGDTMVLDLTDDPTNPVPGKLIYDPTDNTLSFELTGPLEHADPDGDEKVFEVLVPIVHEAGSTNEVPVKITIADDVPAPELPETPTVAESGVPVDFPYDPNYGADGQSDKPDTLTFEIPLEGGEKATGTLEIDYDATEPQELVDTDGNVWATVLFDPESETFSFTAEPDSKYEITLWLTTNDTDGDTGTSDPMIIEVDIPPGPQFVDLESAVDEAFLPEGSRNGQGDPIQVVDVPAGYEVITDGWEPQPDGTLVSPLPGDNGNLIYDPDTGTLSYELTNPKDHPDGNGANKEVYEVGEVPLKNTDTGNTYKVPLMAEIQDDVPDPSLPASGEVQSGIPSEFAYDPNYGADDKSDTKPDTLTFEITLPNGEVITDTFDIDYDSPGQPIEKDGETYATIKFDDATQKFTFTAEPNSDYVIRLTLTTHDTDGDSGSSNRMVIGVGTPPPPPDLEVDGIVNEAYLPEGSLVGEGEPIGVVKIDPEYEVVTTGWTPDPENSDLLVSPLDNGKGNLIYDTTTDTLYYQLTNPLDHPVGDDRNLQENDNVGDVPVRHIQTGNFYEVPLLVDVQDDIPVAEPEQDAIGFAGDWLTGNFDFVYGADGPADADELTLVFTDPDGNSSQTFAPSSVPQTLVINGETLGTFVFADDGTLSFMAVDGTNGELNVVLTVTDSDGDEVSSDPLRVSYAAKLINLPFDGDDPFDEANLVSGTNPDNDALTKWVEIPDGWTVDPFVGGWVEDPASGTWSLEYPAATDPYDTLTGYFTYDPSTPDKLYFTLEDRVDHTAPDPSADLGTNRPFEHVIKFVHTNGSESMVTVELTVEDDIPDVGTAPENNSLTLDDPSVVGALWVLAGADGSDNENDDELAFDIRGAYEGPNGTSLDSGLPSSVVLDKDGTPQVFETPAGVLTLWYEYDDSTSPPTNVRYSYEARYGFEGYAERFVFSQIDTDGDTSIGNLNFNFDDTFTGDLGLQVDEAAIPGLGSGQHFLQGDNIDSMPLPPALVLENASRVTWGEPDNAASLRADGNGDGVYNTISWRQVGNTYEGWAEGELIISVEAMFANGVFTGEIVSTLNRPIYHTRPGALDEALDIKFSLTQSNAGEAVTMGVNVNVRDDSPMRDYFNADDHGGSLIIIDHSGESSHQYESVYITLDASCSMSYNEGQKAVGAIKALAQSYIDNGVDAVFTLTGFHCQATTYYSHVTAQQLISSLDWSQLSRGKYAYFDVGLAETMRQMEMGVKQYENYHQTLYFLSDGCACCSYSQLTAWQSYMARRGDSLDVNVINVDECTPTACKLQYLIGVAGGSQNYYHVNNYEVLLNQFTDLVHTDVTGNMLGDIASADYTILYGISIDGGQLRPIEAYGSQFNLGDGVTLTVYQNGDYRIEAGKLTDDVIRELSLIIKDADGDTVEVQGNLILRDIAKAYDNVGVTEPYGITDPLANFDCTSSNMLLGCYRYTCFTGVVLPGIPEYNTDLLGCRGYAALFSANKCVDGASALRSLVGGAAAVNEMFNDMGMVSQTYGSNAIVSFNVTDAGGTIAFNWAFKAGAAKYGLDSLFWFVTDSDGNVVNSGLLSQGNSCNWSSGVAYVDLPNYYDTYTLYIVQQEMGAYNLCPDSCLFLKDVVYFGDDQLRTVGNVLSDPSPDGFVDSLDAGSYLSYIVYDGREYLFQQDGKLEIDCGDGTLYISNNGTYTFISDEGVTGNVVKDFTYYVRTPDGDSLHADLHIRSSDKIINGTDGADELYSSGSSGNLIQAGAGDDIIHGSNGNEVIYAGAGNDTVYGGGGDDIIHGGHGSDLLYGDAGNDTIYGGGGNDALYGGDGDDLLWGGSGINFLNGGAGADTFAWDKFSTGGRDIIADFNGKEGDKLRFDDLLDNRLADFELNADQTGIIFQINFGSNTLNKTVEVRFSDADNSFADVVAAYNDSSSNSYHDDALLINYIQQFII